ncbi:hypothetical protein SAY87_030733 [Trapa incisa]|uniref:FAS1 domain-containing protein n=1 Tax=Trapa incisa TaxID=236973 RepID=A0AAN7KN08_9MYRT|nr:hypothetical protein SAY87_030733 [Trapa incisa]
MELTVSSSTNKWRRCPVYFTAAAVLAFFAISSAIHSHGMAPIFSLSNGPSLSLNASRALQGAGCSTMAILISVVPAFFSSASPNITIFALPDSALSRISSFRLYVKPFVRYHALPVRLTAADLAKKAEGTCLPTLSPVKSLLITKSEGNCVEINDAPVTDLDLYLDERVAIHGVHKAFASLADLQEVGKNLLLNQVPLCDSDPIITAAVSEVSESKKKEQERSPRPADHEMVVRFLDSHGFSSFAYGLKKSIARFDRTLRDSNVSATFTMFAPRELAGIPTDHPVLDKLVSAHIDYTDLLKLPAGESLRTIDPAALGVEVTRSNVAGGVAVNGLKITRPEGFMSEKFVVHGITRPFDVEGHLIAGDEKLLYSHMIHLAR